MLIKLTKRPISSALLLTKLLVLITTINFVIVFIDFIVVQEDDTDPAKLKTYHVELSKNPDEPTSSSVKPGARTKYLTMEELLQSKEDDPNVDAIDFSNVFLSVRTANQYHVSRLKILLDTWISLCPASTWIFTDEDDPWLKRYIRKIYQRDVPTLTETHCPTSAENKYALACKMYWEYRTFLSSGRAWFCHFDDDTYVNVNMLLRVLSRLEKYRKIYLGKSPSRKPITVMSYDTVLEEPKILDINGTENDTKWFIPKNTYKRVSFHYAMGGAGFCISKQLAIDMKQFALGSEFIKNVASIAMPDDCVIGFIITHLLNVSLISADFFHSHLEDIQAIEEYDLFDQVTISYKLPHDRNEDNIENTKFFHGHSSDITISRDSSVKVINIKGIYSSQIDPTRFYCFHHRLTGFIKTHPADYIGNRDG